MIANSAARYLLSARYNRFVRTVVQYVTESSGSSCCLNDVPNDEVKRSGKHTMTICSRNCSGTVCLFLLPFALLNYPNERANDFMNGKYWWFRLCIIINGIAAKWFVLCALWCIPSASTHTRKIHRVADMRSTLLCKCSSL